MTLDQTVLRAPRDVWSTHKVYQALYTGPDSYPAGGDPVAPSVLGWNSFDAILFAGAAFNGSAVRLLAWDRDTETIRWFVPNTGAEVAGGVDLSGYTVVVTFVGHG